MDEHFKALIENLYQIATSINMTHDEKVELIFDAIVEVRNEMVYGKQVMEQ